jgi:hypothetical protein
MAKGYKIRISDGSEIGPMDLQGVRDWYTQGLIDKDSLVYSPSIDRWVPLQQALASAPAGAPVVAKRATPPPQRATAPPRPAPRPAAPRGSPSRDSGRIPSAAPGRSERPAVELPWRAIGLAAGGLLGLGVVVGAAWFWLRPGADEARILEWTGPESVVEDPVLDVRLSLGRGWRKLRPEQPLITVPETARAALAHPRRGAFGYLITENVPGHVVSADDCLTRVLEQRRRSGTAVVEAKRSDVRLGKVQGREAEGTWTAEDRTHRDLTVAAKEGATCVALVAWLPGEGSGSELAALRAGLAIEGVVTARVAQAVQSAVEGVPHLSQSAAEMVMSSSDAKVLPPETAFRRAFELADRGVPDLTPAESRELGSLVASACANLSARDRTRLMTYFERVRQHRLTTPDEDREMAALMKSGVGRLGAQSRTRLQDLYEKAIRSGLRRG